MISVLVILLYLISDGGITDPVETHRELLWNSNRDKSGTLRRLSNDGKAQITNSQWFTKLLGLRAEREGFEPSDGKTRHRFSRPAHSAALAPLRYGI